MEIRSIGKKGDWRGLVWFVLLVGGLVLGFGTMATKLSTEYGIDTRSNYSDAYNLIGNISEIQQSAQDTISGEAVSSGTAEDSLWRNSYKIAKNILFGLPKFYLTLIKSLQRDFGLPTWLFNILIVGTLVTIIYLTVSWVLGRTV